MAMEADDPRPRVAHEIGQDLSTLSVDEIDRRVELLKGEIDRLLAERKAKASSRAAADAFFKFS